MKRVLDCQKHGCKYDIIRLYRWLGPSHHRLAYPSHHRLAYNRHGDYGFGLPIVIHRPLAK